MRKGARGPILASCAKMHCALHESQCKQNCKSKSKLNWTWKSDELKFLNHFAATWEREIAFWGKQRQTATSVPQAWSHTQEIQETTLDCASIYRNCQKPPSPSGWRRRLMARRLVAPPHAAPPSAARRKRCPKASICEVLPIRAGKCSYLRLHITYPAYTVYMTNRME